MRPAPPRSTAPISSFASRPNGSSLGPHRWRCGAAARRAAGRTGGNTGTRPGSSRLLPVLTGAIALLLVLGGDRLVGMFNWIADLRPPTLAGRGSAVQANSATLDGPLEHEAIAGAVGRAQGLRSATTGAGWRSKPRLPPAHAVAARACPARPLCGLRRHRRGDVRSRPDLRPRPVQRLGRDLAPDDRGKPAVERFPGDRAPARPNPPTVSSASGRRRPLPPPVVENDERPRRRLKRAPPQRRLRRAPPPPAPPPAAAVTGGVPPSGRRHSTERRRSASSANCRTLRTCRHIRCAGLPRPPCARPR